MISQLPFFLFLLLLLAMFNLNRWITHLRLHLGECGSKNCNGRRMGDGWTLKHQDLEEGKIFLLSMFFLCILCWSFALMPLNMCALCLWMIPVCVLCLVHLNLCFVAFYVVCLLCYKLMVCASNICALCIFCYELFKRRLWVVSFWFVLWTFGIWTFCAMNSQRRDFRVSKGLGLWMV